MRGQVPGEMCLHAYGSDTGTAPSMRDTEGLMQIEVANVCAEIAGPAESHQRVQIRAVHKDLSSVAVNKVADLRDILLEHAMGRRVRHHQRSEGSRMPFRFAPEIRDIDIPLGVTLNR